MKMVGLPVTLLTSGLGTASATRAAKRRPRRPSLKLIGIECELRGVSLPGPRGASASWWASSRSCMSQNARRLRAAHSAASEARRDTPSRRT